MPKPHAEERAAQPALDALVLAARAANGDGKGRGLPPVERWNPPFCGNIDMVIKADASWHYMGSRIGRLALVKLFASILRKDDEQYVLVTPVERVGITVEDVPFLAVEMAVDNRGDDQVLSFRTNLDDITTVGPGCGMRFEREAGGGYRPYVEVRRGLFARVTRAVYYDLVAMGTVHEVEGRPMFGVFSAGAFFAIAGADEVADELSGGF
jgi:uncharacterized protein